MSQNLLKEMFKPSRIYPLLLIFLMFAWWEFYLQPIQDAKKEMYRSTDGYFKIKEKTDLWNVFSSDYKNTVKGTCMGVVAYTIHYYDEENRNLKPQVDSLLAVFNKTFSTYDSTSLISTFNKGTSIQSTPWISDLHKRSSIIYKTTNGAFDPTVASLVGFWGFGENKDKFESRDSSKIDSMRALVAYDKIKLEKNVLIKGEQNVILDYGAVAKGYGVDVVADFFKQQGIKSFMVEIGGEIVVGDFKPNGEAWSLAVEEVNANERKGRIFISLSNKAIATSGSYRNFIEDKASGKSYNHTINPHTGYPAVNSLVSATIIHEKCLEADALATAMMVMGLKESISYAKKHNLAVCFIYNEKDEYKTYCSNGFSKLISK